MPGADRYDESASSLLVVMVSSYCPVVHLSDWSELQLLVFVSRSKYIVHSLFTKPRTSAGDGNVCL